MCSCTQPVSIRTLKRSLRVLSWLSPLFMRRSAALAITVPNDADRLASRAVHTRQRVRARGAMGLTPAALVVAWRTSNAVARVHEPGRWWLRSRSWCRCCPKTTALQRYRC